MLLETKHFYGTSRARQSTSTGTSRDKALLLYLRRSTFTILLETKQFSFDCTPRDCSKALLLYSSRQSTFSWYLWRQSTFTGTPRDKAFLLVLPSLGYSGMDASTNTHTDSHKRRVRACAHSHTHTDTQLCAAEPEAQAGSSPKTDRGNPRSVNAKSSRGIGP